MDLHFAWPSENHRLQCKYKYKDIGFHENNTLKYNSELHCMMMDGEDITLTYTHRNEAKFLNTIATPILTTMIEGLRELEQAAKAAQEAE